MDSEVETSGHMIMWSHESVVQTKTFECTFCKRRFSNAQALGGHMNVHRKDKAKLNDLSPSHDCPASHKVLENDVESKVVQKKEIENEKGKENLEVERSRFEEGIKEMNYGELDLELRLGPEPDHANSRS